MGRKNLALRGRIEGKSTREKGDGERGMKQQEVEQIQTAKKKLFSSWIFLISSFIWKNLLKYQHYLRRDPISQINETFSVKGNVQSRVRPGLGLRAGWLVCRTGWTPGLSPRLSWESSPSFSSLSFSIKETSRHTIPIARSPRNCFSF